MDHFHEEIVYKRNRMPNLILSVALLFGLVAFAGYAFFELMRVMRLEFYIMNIALMLLSGGAAYGCFAGRKYLHVEFEYTFTNGEMDFAKVISNEKRVFIGTSKVRDFVGFGPASGEEFARHARQPGVKIVDMCLNQDARRYFFADTAEGQKRLFIMEPSEKLVDLICQYHPRTAVK